MTLYRVEPVSYTVVAVIGNFALVDINASKRATSELQMHLFTLFDKNDQKFRNERLREKTLG